MIAVVKIMTKNATPTVIAVQIRGSVKEHFEQLKEFFGVESDEELIRVIINDCWRFNIEDEDDDDEEDGEEDE
jgi:hypothetical protein